MEIEYCFKKAGGGKHKYIILKSLLFLFIRLLFTRHKESLHVELMKNA